MTSASGRRERFEKARAAAVAGEGGGMYRPSPDMRTRDLVFVSYSHCDAAWRDRLGVFIKPWVRNQRLTYWADPYIEVGGDWRREIHEALARARVGVLLLSPQFLASDFIWEHELPPLLGAHHAGELKLVCIHVLPCSYKATELERIQAANAPSVTLSELSEAGWTRELVRIVEEVIVPVFSTGLREETPSAQPVLPTTRTVEAVAVGPSPSHYGELHGVPDLPPHYLPRGGMLGPLKRALLGTHVAVAISGTRRGRTSVQGLGGVGKSVLAQALARDDEVRAAFPTALSG